jgi:YVTN family beta-propeller protein
VSLAGNPEVVQYSAPNNLVYELDGQAHIPSQSLNPGNYMLTPVTPPNAVGYGSALNPSGTDIIFINASVGLNDQSLQGYAAQSYSLSSYTVMGLSPNGNLAYVTTFGSGDTVQEISTPGAGNPMASVASPITLSTNYPTYIAFNPSGTFALVTTEQTNPGDVDLINVVTNSIYGSPIAVGQTPVAIAFNPQGTYAYVANQNGHSVSIISMATLGNSGTITLPGGVSPHSIAVQP